MLLKAGYTQRAADVAKGILCDMQKMARLSHIFRPALSEHANRCVSISHFLHCRVHVCYDACMTKLLEEAINELRNLPEDEQDAAADALFAYISSDERQYHLRSDQIAEVHRIQRAFRDGKTRLATDAEVSAVKKKSRI
jgi:hypothetical protein